MSNRFKRSTNERKEIVIMRGSSLLAALASLVLFAGIASAAQYPIMEKVATKVIQKYRQSSCEELWQEKAQHRGQPKPEMEERAMQALRNDPQMRRAFLDRVSGPIANKMFECGMIP